MASASLASHALVPPSVSLPPSSELGELDRSLSSAEAVLRWALDRFGERLAIVTSFQAEGIVLLDLVRRVDRSVRVVTIDTGRLPSETHALIDEISERFGIEIEVFHPDHVALDALVRRRGPSSFLRSVEDRLACCRIRKVEPLARALEGLDAWVVGLRRDQSPERRSIDRLSIEQGRLKLAPLADWSEERVWSHLRRHDLPYHALYDQGYRSIGCAPCSRPVRVGEGPRAGRWWWEDDGKKECGLHLAGAFAKVSREEGGVS